MSCRWQRVGEQEQLVCLKVGLSVLGWVGFQASPGVPNLAVTLGNTVHRGTRAPTRLSTAAENNRGLKVAR